MNTFRFKVVAVDPTNNYQQFSRTFYGRTVENVETEANLLFGTENVVSVEPDTTPCFFDQWREGRLTYPDGHWSVKLFDLFISADADNQERLAGSFPEHFAGTTY